MYPISGLVTPRVSRRSPSARAVVGSCMRSSSALNTFSVFLFSVTVCGSTLMPAASAAFSFGRAIGSSFAAGSRRRGRSVKAAREGGLAQAPRQVGEVGQERALDAEAADRRVERRRVLLDRLLQAARAAVEGGERVG